MKDAYSFDTSWEGLNQTYTMMYDAYMRIFTRCGFHFRAVEAEAGAIGGEGETHEFMALADVGEDTIAACTVCGYAANLEKTQSGNTIPSGESSVRNAAEADRCPHCEEGELQFYKGIEVGHVFKLGTKYSEALGARYADAGGNEQTMIMGCYGIGISRMMAAIVEQHHDERGIVWPLAIAPYQVHLVPISAKDEAQMKLAHELYDTLRSRGAEVLLDDRDERVGVKLSESDLIGLPVRIVIGKDAANQKVEYVERNSNEKHLLSKDEAVNRMMGLLEKSGV